MMFLIPYSRFILITTMSPEEVCRKLEENTEPNKFFRGPFFSHDHKPYQGVVSKDEFHIRRIIHYRNSFLPKIHGRIKEDFGKTRIEIFFGWSPVMMVFISALIILPFLGLLISGLYESVKKGEASLILLLAGFFFFGYLMGLFFFKLEVYSEKASFKEMFKGTL